MQKKKKSVFVTGNTVVDALRFTLGNDFHRPSWNLPTDYRLILFTAHRRESMGMQMKGMFNALKQLVDEHPDVIAVCPLHHNPQVREAAEIIRGHERIRVIEPPDILSFHQLLARTYLAITDSGGIQEEAPGLGKPVLVMRDTTERPEALEVGTVKLVGANYSKIVSEASRLLNDSAYYDQMSQAVNPYGDGYACNRIVNVLNESNYCSSKP